MPELQHATWGELLRDAVAKPGRMLEAYTAFHNYSFGNALLALEQCVRRSLQPGPLNTYRGWLERKRQVRKGEKGITLCMPMPFKRAAQADSVEEEATESDTPRPKSSWMVNKRQDISAKSKLNPWRSSAAKHLASTVQSFAGVTSSTGSKPKRKFRTTARHASSLPQLPF